MQCFTRNDNILEPFVYKKNIIWVYLFVDKIVFNVHLFF